MTVTATTKASRSEIIQSLDMQKPELIIVPPVKYSIIFYAVAKKPSISFAFVPLAKNWQSKLKAKHGTDNYILPQI